MLSGEQSPLTILVVEDEWLVRYSIVGFLQRAGCEVMEAGCGEDAVELLATGNGIDAVFTDLRLGGAIDGWDVGEAARATHPDRPVIYTSGDAIRPERPVPGSVFIRKPYDPEEVLASCKDLCETQPPSGRA